MLLIQEINLIWHKEERGAEGEKVRGRFPSAYPLEKRAFSGDVIVQRLNFFQEGSMIMDSMQEAGRSLERHLPQYGFTRAQIQQEIQNRILWIKNQQYQYFASVEALNLTNLSVCYGKQRYEVTFFYDERRSGKPFRRGHNKDFQNPASPFCGRDVLNETVFELAENQYGRVIWNERSTDYDNGTWYYQQHIYNLFHLPGQTFSEDIFVRNSPDYEYEQIASLHW